jgi:hypothetical protein
MHSFRFPLRVAFACASTLFAANAHALENWSTQFAPPPGGQGVAAGTYTRVMVQMEFRGDLIVGGEFTQAGNVTARGIARWDGTAWHSLATGLNGNAYALAIYNNDLIVGGWFTDAGGVPVNNIARWDGNAWSALGDGIGSMSSGAVASLAIYGGDLVAGGVFSFSGNTPAHLIARWDGSHWSELGGGIHGDNAERVMALLTNGNELIVGGHFSQAGNQSIARWNGSTWSSMAGEALGDGPFVEDFLDFGGQIYAAGDFYPIGQGLDGVVRWDGTTWQMLGNGLAGGGVQSLTVYNNQIVAGGYFSTPVPFVSRWDGNAWQALGTSVDGVVYSVAAKDGDLFVGGWFSHAGGNASSRIAKWSEITTGVPEAPTASSFTLAPNLPNPFRASTTISYALTRPGAVRLSIFDVAGRQVATLVDEPQSAGDHQAVWDGRDRRGRLVAAGVYMYRLESGSEVGSRRMLRLQ